MSATVDLLDTLDLCAALKTKLAAIVHPTLAEQKLFEVVEFHGDKNLSEALQELIILKKRVCLIVPAGDRFTHEKIGRAMQADRTTSIDLVMADQAYTKGGHDAAFGGARNVGVIAMKDLVTKSIGANPQLADLRWCALYPVDGALIELSAADAKAAPGRQAFALNYETPSGRIVAPLTAPWPAPSAQT